jgi:glycosyltransferase involved in cell wall biosynthesis
MKPENIIVINDHGTVTGGAAQVAISSLNYLADAGYNVTFISSAGTVDDSIDQSKVRVHNFGFYELMSNPSRLSAALYGIWDPRCAQKLDEILKEFVPNNTIIHLHTWSKSLSSSIIRKIIKRKFPFVCTLHDYFSVCPNGGLYDFQRQEHCNLKPMSLSCALTNCDARSFSQKLWRVGRQCVQQIFGKMPEGVSNFITLSDYSENILRKYLPHNADYYRVGNPISVVKASPASPQESSVFSFVGRLSPEKGAVVFARASKLSGVHARFVGAGNEYACILSENSDSEMVGWQSHDDVLQKIRSSRALVFPSLCHEAQPLTVMEAAALGIPSIVADTCAAKDFVENGVTGLLFRSNDVTDLSSKLATLNNQPEYAYQLGNAAYKRYWSSPSSMEVHVSNLLLCYSEILRKAE